jgi:hypothetical protein
MSTGRLLMTEVILAIHSGELPLHLAVQITPEAMASGWAAIDLDTQRDLLESIEHPGLVRVALAAAAQMAELLGSDDADASIANALRVFEHREPPSGLVRAIASAYAMVQKEQERKTSYGAICRRWGAIARTLQAVQVYTEGFHPARAVAYASQAIRQALPDRPSSLPAMIHALGPPTLEQVFAAVQAQAEVLGRVP